MCVFCDCNKMNPTVLVDLKCDDEKKNATTKER